MRDLSLAGGTVLLPRDGLQRVDVAVRGGRIDSVGDAGAGSALLDVSGLLVLPGIVDLHGDAFERQIQPRPGVDFPVDLALRDTEAQLLANGITTAFHGVTLSWEPGLRSLAAWRAILDALAAGQWTCDMRVHLRWEAYNLDALDTAVADIEAGRVHLVAFNDHTPSILRKLNDAVEGAKYAGRAGMKMAAFRALADSVAARADAVPAGLDRIAAAATAAGLPMASHDDDSVEVRNGFRARGARICEFPMGESVAEAAVAAGDFVAMGCPNVVRGGSHLGWASAARLAEAGLCRVLTSDYYYPAMSRAAFILAERGVLGLAEAWALISENPARAGNLHDRGVIEADKRADLVVVDPVDGRLLATIVEGRIAHLNAAASTRMSWR
ncbi:alpha-D-ribose 1-methylphosphonate 5-triphosphate diphosphatase [Rhodopila sp.]|jgi:alpha-D-ribose 1-methylphosphonate 5-triphosphate diphosphatase|uniref:alpha-D-ribose 1-methylphosphonate 5-triphosphate diphosphatase n=1 Tax=Rhodopila sp. TaxID=2480087 RepID=UPI002C113D54|nr:alpha-D-ribose 1-methylphosphonate 5-triphosphate diphosphatase [Rhodopila sp.]HVZ06340.1 alpha-D-ribose 1-methylphosphonate 5-triphosphate diphosphatase [Rhodopila sp.]